MRASPIGGFALTRNRFVERVPSGGCRDQRLDLPKQRTATVAVRHDHAAVAFPNMGEQIAPKAPVLSAVREVPALAAFVDHGADANGPTPTGVTISRPNAAGRTLPLP